MTHKVGAKGQVVIPKRLREEFGIRPGDDVVFWAEADHVAVRSTSEARPLRGRFTGSGLRAELEAERRRDRGRDRPGARRE